MKAFYLKNITIHYTSFTYGFNDEKEKVEKEEKGEYVNFSIKTTCYHGARMGVWEGVWEAKHGEKIVHWSGVVVFNYLKVWNKIYWQL